MMSKLPHTLGVDLADLHDLLDLKT